METPTKNLVELIPPSPAVRERLSAALLEVQLLRDLLKVAERKERQSGDESRKAVAHAR